jgi:hypothetical protein
MMVLGHKSAIGSLRYADVQIGTVDSTKEVLKRFQPVALEAFEHEHEERAAPLSIPHSSTKWQPSPSQPARNTKVPNRAQNFFVLRDPQVR